jgi:hypothetical protein|tara:strand:+ start:209 stop:559 length:351 start_codon:yes stop_codon:yes gene_type:complete
MVILQAIATEQSISFIPRSQTYDKLFIQNEATGVEKEITITSFTNGDYFDTINATFVNGTFSLLQNNFYKLTLKNGTTTVHKDRIFCTNQTPVVNYSVNDGEFKQTVSNNEFIIYE